MIDPQCIYCGLLSATITDNGIGIPEANLQRLGSLFGNMDANNSKGILTKSGIDLGLMVSKQLSEEPGGSINIQSHFGQDT